ncbi:MAG: exosortase O [Bacteroidia bacterium]|jgi:exosortase O|tara:strand:+ start:75 stop:1514 length:1440 start_codon:yes stop_codon:yes gene_type:complete
MSTEYKLSLVNIVLLILAMVFFWESIAWICERVAIGIFKPFNALAAIALGFLVYKRTKGRLSNIVQLQVLPLLPVLIMVLGLVSYRILDFYFGITTFNTLAFLLFLFGYVGLFVDQAVWLKSSIPIVILTLILPFGDLLDTYLGFPLRMQTSNAIEIIIGKLGIDLIDHQTILSLENRYTQVDTTCSGLNVIWAGTLLFIAYSIIERIQFGLKWLALFVAFIAMLLLFNGTRVLILVLLELVLENPKLADVVHVPLGLIGFIIPVLVVWFVLKRNQNRLAPILKQKKESRPRYLFVGQGTVLVLLLSLFAFTPHKEVLAPKPLSISESLDFEPIAITDKEQAYFDFEGSDARKYQLNYKSLRGTIILVASRSFKGHHDPTLCLQSIGLSIKKNEPRIIDGKPFRYLTFRKSSRVGVYWFKSGDEYTDDYSYRVWYDLKNNDKNNNWLQVTALLDNNYTAADLESFFNHINTNVTCNETN